jgi:hypothetical protein
MSYPFWPPLAQSENGVLEGVRRLWAAAFNLKTTKFRSSLLDVVAHSETLVPQCG